MLRRQMAPPNDPNEPTLEPEQSHDSHMNSSPRPRRPQLRRHTKIPSSKRVNTDSGSWTVVCVDGSCGDVGGYYG